MTGTTATYEIDAKWRIVQANAAFCDLFHSSKPALIGRDVRELLRADWRVDFRTYVARAFVGVGDCDATLPMVSPSGEQGWFKHVLEPIIVDGSLQGYRATVTPHLVASAVPAKGRWNFRAIAPLRVWNFDAPLANAS